MTPPLVMLVDDEVSFVEIMTKRLEKRELNIISAFSGREALETLAENQTVDVVILDVKMPGMDGIGTLKEIKTGSSGGSNHADRSWEHRESGERHETGGL